VSVGELRFTRSELRDFAAAWIALSVAFALFFNQDLVRGLLRGGVVAGNEVVRALVLSGLTVGVGFLLHELGHKVVAVHFDQVAVFRADYGMLGLAIVSALAGFLFAAPGAVHHRGRITQRQNGLISLAGPAVNLMLAVTFFFVGALGTGFAASVGSLGLVVNMLLAGFNMIPFGPLDGRKVLAWNRLVYVVTALFTIGPAIFVLFGLGLPGMT
jgi:Zn-dependent protease